MKFWNPFNYLPILGTYRLTYYKAVVLRAPPTVLRLCVLLEVLVAIGVFVVSYYYTATTATTETVVSFEALGSGYTCTVLSPRSDTQSYNDLTSEIAAFSSARFDYSGCTAALGPQGYNLCSDNYRKDYLLTLRGYGTDSSTCSDLILADNYRLCKGSQQEFDLRTSELTLQFPTYPSFTAKFSNQYFFMNSSGTAIFAGSFPSSLSSSVTPFITDGSKTVFVVQIDSSSTSKSMLYSMDRNSSNPKPLQSIGSTNVYGFTYGNKKLFTWTIDNFKGFLYAYDTQTAQQQRIGPYDCPNTSPSADVAGTSSHFLTYGTDGKLYAMCSGTIQNDKPYGFNFFQIDPDTMNAVKFNANVTLQYISDKNAVSNARVNRIGQVFRMGKYMVFTAVNNFNNLLLADMTNARNQNHNISSVSNEGYFPGDYALPSNSYIYFPSSGNQTYYDITQRSFNAHYSLVSQTSHFVTDSLQLAFSYQICNGNYSNYAVHKDTSGSFAGLCGQKNGIFYQKNAIFEVPESCQGSLNSATEYKKILSCSAVKVMQEGFVSSYCSASFSKVCTSEYTDNPPFSCSKDVYPSFVSVIGTAIANSSGAWSAIVIVIQLVLKIFYPHGTIEFDYDESVNRFLPLYDKTANHWHHAKLQVVPEESLNYIKKDERDEQLVNYENARSVDLEKGSTLNHRR